MDIQRIYHRLTLMLGENEFEQELMLMACTSAAKEITRKLKSGVKDDDDRAITAAAGVAFYNLALIKCARDEGEVGLKAGDVNISKKPELYLKSALTIRDNCLKAAMDLICDEDFVFRQVKYSVH